jgi:perosamine synthetase
MVDMSGASDETGRVVGPSPEAPIPVAGPWITEAEVAAVADAVRTAWYGDAGTVIGEFESAFARHVGRAHAISMPSCTSALHVSLAALGIGAGDEVILPDATWIASAAPVDYVGAEVRLVDVDPADWCISLSEVDRAIGERTRAVIAVDLYGGMPPMEELTDLCEARGVALVEDAAEAIGSSYGGRPAGGFGVTSTFSFHGSKTLTTGEGGMVVTDDPDLHQRMLVLRDHGRPPGDVDFYNDEVAFKYKMSALQAALGLAQLERVDDLVEHKRRIFAWYRDRLGGVEGLTLNAEPSGVHNSYWMTTVVLDEGLGITERELARALGARGIATRPFFHPLSSLRAYSGRPGMREAQDRNAVARRLGTYGINLPSALSLAEADVQQVCDALLDVLGQQEGR